MITQFLKGSRGKQILIGMAIAFVGLMLSAVAGEILRLHWLKKLLMIAIIFPWCMMVGRNLFFALIEFQIAFHKKNNSENLQRFPVNWLIKNELKIKRVTAVIWLGGAIFTALAILINE